MPRAPQVTKRKDWAARQKASEMINKLIEKGSDGKYRLVHDSSPVFQEVVQRQKTKSVSDSSEGRLLECVSTSGFE